MLIEALRAAFPALSRGLGADTVLDIPTITQIGHTAMTSDVQIEMGANGLPTTFVPARNLLFLTFAAALAYRRGIKHIVTGVCETDYSGYPDCRDDTIKALQVRSPFEQTPRAKHTGTATPSTALFSRASPAASEGPGEI